MTERGHYKQMDKLIAQVKQVFTAASDAQQKLEVRFLFTRIPHLRVYMGRRRRLVCKSIQH